jgi:hypothetical protein
LRHECAHLVHRAAGFGDVRELVPRPAERLRPAFSLRYFLAHRWIRELGLRFDELVGRDFERARAALDAVA